MRTIYLMRHSKARSSAADTPDKARRLTKRGKRDARAMGVGLAGQEPPPQCVITSPARRALSTAKRVCRGWGYDGTTVSDERLWQQDSSACLELLRALDDTCQSVLLVGHNPSMEELVFLLGDRTLALATSTVVRVDVPVERWDDLRFPADGTVQHVWMADRER